jgi:hypothetical protein
MAALNGTKGYAVVSWLNDFPEERDITGKGTNQDVPFDSVDEAEGYLIGQGYDASLGYATVVVVALVEVKVVE